MDLDFRLAALVGIPLAMAILGFSTGTFDLVVPLLVTFVVGGALVKMFRTAGLGMLEDVTIVSGVSAMTLFVMAFKFLFF